jgi:Rrf2 family protein
MRLELTRRTEYAIRACLRLASADGVVSGPTIAVDTAAPDRFLARILVDLAEAGIVEARIGRSGGYQLRRPAANLTLLELVEAVEGPSRSTRCVLHERSCDASRPCAIHPVWNAAQSGLIGVLAATTLADLVTPASSGAPPGSVDRTALERTA